MLGWIIVILTLIALFGATAVAAIMLSEEPSVGP